MMSRLVTVKNLIKLAPVKTDNRTRLGMTLEGALARALTSSIQVVDESSFAFSTPPVLLVPFCSLTDTQQSSFPGPVLSRGGSSALDAPLSVCPGPPFDVGQSKVTSTVLGWLAAGRVWGLWCGIPSLSSVHRRFLVVLNGSTSHFTVCQCQSTSPSEVISELHEWMDTFQMNPRAICADRPFHHPHDTQAFCRMHNLKRHFQQDRTLFGQIEVRLVYDCSRSFFQHSWILPRKKWNRPRHRSLLKHTSNSEDPASMNPEHLTST